MALIKRILTALPLILSMCTNVSYCTTTTLSTDCGNLIISCNEPDITKCCQGACCSLLSQFQNQEPSTNEDETEQGTVSNYNYKPIPNIPNPMPKIGESCSSRYSKDDRCLGDNTKCMFNDYDSNGYLLGQCCVENNMNGCIKDDDCCRFDGICSNGECLRNLASNTNILQDVLPLPDDNTAEDNTVHNVDTIGVVEVNNDGVNDVQSARSNIEHIHEDLHETKRSKPSYELWISLTANMVIFIVILLASLCGLNCWLYNNYISINIGKKTMRIGNDLMDSSVKREYDIDESDSTEFEDETDQVYSM